MNPDTPQSGKRNTAKSGRSSASSSTTAPTQATGTELNASVESATSTARDTAKQAAEQASNVAEQVRQKAESQLNTQKERATVSLGSMASAVRQTSQKLREEQFDGVAQYVDRAADQLERFSTHLRERDLEQLTDEARRFAREQPALFVGTSFVAGLLAARFLKASSSPAQSWRSGSGSDYGYGAEGSGLGGQSYGSAVSNYGQSDLGRPFGASGTTTSTTTPTEGSYGSFGTGSSEEDVTGRGGL